MIRIFLIGYMGSGKTTIGRMIAKKLNIQFYDLDHYIENKYRTTIALLFQEKGEAAFREIERNCLHEVGEFENVLIATGGGAPCFFDNIDFMNNNGTTIYFRLKANELTERLLAARDGQRPLIANKTPEELKKFIAETIAKREPFYSKAQHIIDAYLPEIEVMEKAIERVGF